jgi:hypothetical protein
MSRHHWLPMSLVTLTYDGLQELAIRKHRPHGLSLDQNSKHADIDQKEGDA